MSNNFIHWRKTSNKKLSINFWKRERNFLKLAKTHDYLLAPHFQIMAYLIIWSSHKLPEKAYKMWYLYINCNILNFSHCSILFSKISHLVSLNQAHLDFKTINFSDTFSYRVQESIGYMYMNMTCTYSTGAYIINSVILV